MPITVLGRQPTFKGRAVLQILLNLKNFGVGRLIARSSFDRYTEPSYYRILKVAPLMDEENIKGSVWVDTVFRGHHVGVEELQSAYQPDFYLLHKEDEKPHCSKQSDDRHEKVLPNRGPLPPLINALINSERRSEEPSITKESYLPMVYSKNASERYRVARLDETPNVNLSNYPKWTFDK